ncbi:hypothetical protein [Rivularia sp. UHCC 0363]|uniref:hypothetical protein n=1 Tax=Rivularia sp. UHCC 0363 TaxID=3110244 RepID=UPI002B21D50A|nr:hypothetical protein [Rivularia sp. UHCC 0363]MEA5598303.1 hypothetical protein [Rivularia sp. UHCC 0363]
MARYTCSYIVSLPIDHLQPLLIQLLQECNLDVQYYTPDYIMAREIPGNVPFSKFVTIEVLIDKSTATETETKMNLVFKNEELPLQVENHCRRVFEFMKQVIEDSRYWHLVETFAS